MNTTATISCRRKPQKNVNCLKIYISYRVWYRFKKLVEFKNNHTQSEVTDATE